jgi:hypothetical protein
MYEEGQEQAAKQAAEKAYYGDRANSPAEPHPVDHRAEAIGIGQAATPSTLRYSLRDEAQKRAMHHAEQAEKAQSAAIFFSQHPEFEEFLRLVRSGSIQF